jgi:hypothetical protein
MHRVWRVVCWHADIKEEPIFEVFFSDRDKAVAVYNKGESEYGRGAGYHDLYWDIEMFYVDNYQHMDQLFEDLREMMEESNERNS